MRSRCTDPEEAAEILEAMARVGFFKQMRLHSQTSQYGTLSRSSKVPFTKEIRAFMENALKGIQNGEFDAEWRGEQAKGYPHFTELRKQADAHPMSKAEEEMRRLVRFPGE